MTVTEGFQDACTTLAVQIELVADTRPQKLVKPIPQKKRANRQTPQKNYHIQFSVLSKERSAN